MLSKKICLFTLLCCLNLFLFSQSQTYDDVGVIVNLNSQASQVIGNYFMQQRNIPAANLIPVLVTTDENINAANLESLRKQVRDHLLANGLDTVLNYLVTTKGLPMRYEAPNGCDASTDITGQWYECASIESELALVLSADSGKIGQAGYVNSKYDNTDQYFSRDSFDYFLVTRLDGYTDFDVLRLIDNSGPGKPVTLNQSRGLLDFYDRTVDSNAQYFKGLLDFDSTALSDLNLMVRRDPVDSVLVRTDSNLFAYRIWNLDNGPVAKPISLSFIKGSIAAIGTPEGHRFSMDASQDQMGAVKAGQLVALGASAVTLEVGSTYSAYIPFFHEVMKTYLDTTVASPYNLAESFYLNTFAFSTPTVIIGDPKTSVIPDFLQGIGGLLPELPELKLFPNPARNQITLQGVLTSPGKVSATVYDLTGRELSREQSRTDGIRLEMELEVGDLPAGMYLIQVRTEEAQSTRRLMIAK